MNTYTASRRRDCLRRVAFWLRSCNDEAAIASYYITREYINKAREAMDDLMLDLPGHRAAGGSEVHRVLREQRNPDEGGV